MKTTTSKLKPTVPTLPINRVPKSTGFAIATKKLGKAMQALFPRKTPGSRYT